MNRPLHLLVLSVAVIVLTADRVSAAPIYFTDRSAFNAAVGSGLNSQSFETAFATAATVNFTGFSMTESGGTNAIANADSSFATSVGLSNAITNGLRMAFFDDNDNSVLTFQFTSPINAFGVDLTTSDPATVAVGGDLSTSLTRAANTPGFFGVFDPTGTFQTVSFTASGGPNVGFDAVTFGTAAAAPIPEPMTLAVFAGVFGLGGLALRRRKLA